jgi:excisionase family DNA binding protein
MADTLGSQARQMSETIYANKKESCPVMTVREAAAYLKCSRNHIFVLINSGLLPFQKMGKHFILPCEAVERLLERGWQQNGK